jgi:hypothetical protein
MALAFSDQRQINLDCFLIWCLFCRIPSVHHLLLPKKDFFSCLEVQSMKHVYMMRSCFSEVHERVNTELLRKADTALPF